MKNFYIILLLSINLILLSLFSYAEHIFVSNENSDTVVVLNKLSKKIIKTIETGGRPRDLKFNNDFSKLYVVVSEENNILVIDLLVSIKMEISTMISLKGFLDLTHIHLKYL